MQINRSHLFRRAWQLAHWNRPTATAPLDFPRWLRFAWAEVRSGEAEAWAFGPASEIDEVRATVVILENRDQLGFAGLVALRAAYARLDQLAA